MPLPGLVCGPPRPPSLPLQGHGCQGPVCPRCLQQPNPQTQGAPKSRLGPSPPPGEGSGPHPPIPSSWGQAEYTLGSGSSSTRPHAPSPTVRAALAQVEGRAPCNQKEIQVLILRQAGSAGRWHSDTETPWAGAMWRGDNTQRPPSEPATEEWELQGLPPSRGSHPPDSPGSQDRAPSHP